MAATARVPVARSSEWHLNDCTGTYTYTVTPADEARGTILKIASAPTPTRPLDQIITFPASAAARVNMPSAANSANALAITGGPVERLVSSAGLLLAADLSLLMIGRRCRARG
jgi:hypothetical protein